MKLTTALGLVIVASLLAIFTSFFFEHRASTRRAPRVVYASEPSKLWLHDEGGTIAGESDEYWHVGLAFVEDRETGTRCYVATTGSGVSIACVPRGGAR